MKNERQYMTATLIIKLTAALSLNLKYSTAHWKNDKNPSHGPQVWPWWLLFSLSLISLDTMKPTTGKRLWAYTRWGAVYADFILDRRRVVSKRIQGWINKWS